MSLIGDAFETGEDPGGKKDPPPPEKRRPSDALGPWIMLGGACLLAFGGGIALVFWFLAPREPEASGAAELPAVTATDTPSQSVGEVPSEEEILIPEAAEAGETTEVVSESVEEMPAAMVEAATPNPDAAEEEPEPTTSLTEESVAASSEALPTDFSEEISEAESSLAVAEEAVVKEAPVSQVHDDPPTPLAEVVETSEPELHESAPVVEPVVEVAVDTTTTLEEIPDESDEPVAEMETEVVGVVEEDPPSTTTVSEEIAVDFGTEHTPEKLLVEEETVSSDQTSEGGNLAQVEVEENSEAYPTLPEDGLSGNGINAEEDRVPVVVAEETLPEKPLSQTGELVEPEPLAELAMNPGTAEVAEERPTPLKRLIDERNVSPSDLPEQAQDEEVSAVVETRPPARTAFSEEPTGTGGFFLFDLLDRIFGIRPADDTEGDENEEEGPIIRRGQRR